MTKDPVCEMPIEEGEAGYQLEYNDKIYYFCSVGCKDEFTSTPEAYLKNIDLGEGYGEDGDNNVDNN